MAVPLLATKLYIPSPRPTVVRRARLIERLNRALHNKPGVTLVSAPAGFGKTTLLIEWVATSGQKVAWLSLDEEDNDPTRFFTYLIAAIRTVVPEFGADALRVLQTPRPQPLPLESMLTSHLNELTAIGDDLLLVLDDYHVLESRPLNQALMFLIEHMPPHLHLVLATREDPNLPLARLRARGQLFELRAADLRFTADEAAEFLNQGMRLQLSPRDVAVLEQRTEGWIAGLQLAALSMQGRADTANFIESFTGSHRFVLDYLVEEVLHRQPHYIQRFLLRTSILERMCAPLCDAVLPDHSLSGQETLEYLERANLFIVPLDQERRWYRYHHLFAELLRQRMQHSVLSSTPEHADDPLRELHIRASQWYEDNGLDVEAFQHAAAAGDIDRAERLIEGKGIPLHMRGAVTAVLDWLESLPISVLEARPWLWWRHATLLLVSGQTTGVEEKLQAAETALIAALHGAEADNQTRHWIGRIAAARAVLALTRYDAEAMLTQSRRALEYLPADNLSTRANANWTLGYGYLLLGDRESARQALTEGVALSQACGDVFTNILASIGLGNVQETANELHAATETYRRVLQLAGDQPLQILHEAQLGLARVLYEWNELDAAQTYGEQSLQLARQYERVIDRFLMCEVFLARLKLARGDVAGAAAILRNAEQSARQQGFMQRLPEIAAGQVLVLVRQGNLEEAARLAQAHQLPLSQARVHIARGEAAATLTVLEQFRQRVEERGWKDEQLRALILQALAYDVQGEKERALQALQEALLLAEPEGFIRSFVDEGAAMAKLLSEAAVKGILPDYVSTLQAAFDVEPPDRKAKPSPSLLPLIEPLSQRELEVLQLIAEGLSNDEIGKRLFLALDTVKGHNRRIYDKLQVQRRTEAVARARELGLLKA
jgi:LuxR family transcriptional regulator, maltose regulon positive regulatory protein